MSSSALVFGGTGFIGGHVARKLEKPRVFRRSASRVIGLDDVEFVVGDLDDRESMVRACDGVDTIYFCAAYYPHVSARADSQVQRATGQLENLFAAAPSNSTIVFVSSYSTIGSPKKGELADERTPYNLSLNASTYFQIKYEMERFVLERSARRRGRTVVVCPTGVFGDFDIKPTSSRIVIDAAMGRIPFRLKGDVNAVDVHDVALGIIAAGQKGRSGERYILGGENTRIETMLDMVCEIVGRKPPRIPLPFTWMRGAAHVSESLHRAFGRKGFPLIPITGVDLLENAMHVSSGKAERELGYTSGPVRPALVRAYEWFVANGYLSR